MRKFNRLGSITAGAVLSTALLVAGCGSGGSGGGGATTPPPPGHTSNVSGTSAKGLVLGGLVEAFNMDNELIASTTTSIENASYQLELPTGFAGLLRLRLKPQEGAQVICDAPTCANGINFGDRYPLNFEMSSLVKVEASSTTVSAAITPMTTLVYRHVRAQANADEAALANANNFVRDLLGLDADPAMISPVDITTANTDASTDAVRYALINAAFATLANDAGDAGLDSVFASLSENFAINSASASQLTQLKQAAQAVAAAVDPAKVPSVTVAAKVVDAEFDAKLASCEADVCAGPPPRPDDFENNLDQAKALVASVRAIAADLMNQFLDEDGNTQSSVQALLDNADIAARVLADDPDVGRSLTAFGEAAAIALFHLLDDESGAETISLADAAENFYAFLAGEGEELPEDFSSDNYDGSISIDGATATVREGKIREVSVTIQVALPEDATVGPDTDGGILVAGEAGVANITVTFEETGIKLQTSEALVLSFSEWEGFEGNELKSLELLGDLQIANTGDNSGRFQGAFILKLVRNESLAVALNEREGEALEGEEEPAEDLSAVALLPSLIQLNGAFVAGNTSFNAGLVLSFDNAAELILPADLFDSEREGDIESNEDNRFVEATIIFQTSGTLGPDFSNAQLSVQAQRTGFLQGSAKVTIKVDKAVFEISTVVDREGDSYADLQGFDPVIILSDTKGAEFQARPLASPLVARIVKDGTVYGTLRREGSRHYLISWSDGTIESVF